MATLILRGDQHIGPLSDQEIMSGLQSGQYSKDDLGWREGLQEWSPLGLLFPDCMPSLPEDSSLDSPQTRANAGESVRKWDQSPLRKPVSMVTSAIAILVGVYCGSMAMFVGAGLIAGFVLVARVKPKGRGYILPISLLCAQLFWGFIGVCFEPSALSAIGMDLLLLLCGVVWLMFAPGVAPVVLLGIYQFFGLSVNVLSLAHSSFGSEEHKALTLWVCLRLATLIMLIVNYWILRKHLIPPLPPRSAGKSQKGSPAPFAARVIHGTAELPPPLSQSIRPKRWTWRTQGWKTLCMFGAIGVCIAVFDYLQKGRLDPTELAGIGIMLAIVIPTVAFAGWLVNKAE